MNFSGFGSVAMVRRETRDGNMSDTLHTHSTVKWTFTLQKMVYTCQDVDNDVDIILKFRSEQFDVACSGMDANMIPSQLEGALRHFSDLRRVLEFAGNILPEREGSSTATCDHCSITKFSSSPMNQSAFLALLPAALVVEDVAACGSYIGVDDRQLTKDTERDRFFLGGRYVVGADGGLDYIVSVLQGDLCDVCSQSGLVAPHEVVLKRMCRMALACGNRTNSSGIALECLRDALDPSVVLAPDSDAATPISVSARLGCLEESAWGLMLSLKASTSFRLLEEDSMEDTAVVEVEYAQTVGLAYRGEVPEGPIHVPKQAHVTLRRSHNRINSTR